jgi:hypothetical protein
MSQESRSSRWPCLGDDNFGRQYSFHIFWTANASRYQMTLDLAQRETRRQLLVPTPRRPFFGGGLSQSWWFFGLCLVVWSVVRHSMSPLFAAATLASKTYKSGCLPNAFFLDENGPISAKKCDHCCRIDPVVALAPTATR